MVDIRVARNLPPGHGDGSWVMTATGVSAPVICTMSFHFTGPPTDPQMEQIQAAWGTHIMPMISNHLTLVNFHVFYKVDAENDMVFDAQGAPVAGSGGLPTTASTPQVAILVRKQTQFAGRRNVGRMYIPGVPEGAADQLGNVSASLITDWTGRLTSFYGAILPFNPEIVHSKQYDADVTPVAPIPPAPTPVVGLSVDNVVATQRRRLHR